MWLRFPRLGTHPFSRMKSLNEGMPRDLPSGQWLLGMGEDCFIVPNYSRLYARICIACFSQLICFDHSPSIG